MLQIGPKCVEQFGIYPSFFNVLLKRKTGCDLGNPIWGGGIWFWIWDVKNKKASWNKLNTHTHTHCYLSITMKCNKLTVTSEAGKPLNSPTRNHHRSVAPPAGLMCAVVVMVIIIIIIIGHLSQGGNFTLCVYKRWQLCSTVWVLLLSFHVPLSVFGWISLRAHLPPGRCHHHNKGLLVFPMWWSDGVVRGWSGSFRNPA